MACLAQDRALAGNWVAAGSVFERFEAHSNIFLDEENEGALYGSTTGIDLALGYDTRRTVWGVETGASFREFVGPGDADGLEGFSDPELTASVEHRSRRHLLEAQVDVRRRSLAFTEIDEAELSVGEGTETDLGGEFDWTMRATPRTTLSLGADADVRRFSDEAEGVVPSESIGFSAGATRALSPRSEAGLALVGSTFSAEGTALDTSVDILTALVTIDTRPTKRHRIGFGAGIGYFWAESTDTSGSAFVESMASQPTFNGSLEFHWQATPRAEVGLIAAHELETTLEGAIASATGVTARLSRRLTARSTLTADASFMRLNTLVAGEASESEDETSRLFELSSAVTTELTRNWTAAAGLEFRRLRDDETDANSAGVFVELRRAFDVLR